MCEWYVMNFPFISCLSLSQCVFMCTPGVPLTPSYVMRAVREMEDWWGERRLGQRRLGHQLFIPQSKLKEIRQTFPDEMDQKKQAVLYWINTDPAASWRRLVQILDGIRETKLADSIRANAEPLTGIDMNVYIHVHAHVRILAIRCGVIVHLLDHVTGYHIHVHCKNVRVVFTPSLVISVASHKHFVRIRKYPFTLTTNSLLVRNTQPPCIPH